MENMIEAMTNLKKKVKCNNINVNLNGIDVNIGLPFNNGPVTNLVALAQDDNNDDEIESNYIENDNDKSYDGADGKSNSNTNSKIVCINNNNNTIIEAPEEPEPPVNNCADIEACFEEHLIPTDFELLTNALENGLIVEISEENVVSLNSFADICEALEGLSFDELDNAVLQILEAANATVLNNFEISICIAEVFDIPIPPPV
jgi:hypothetical protein